MESQPKMKSQIKKIETEENVQLSVVCFWGQKKYYWR